jgi:hypothetical protein
MLPNPAPRTGISKSGQLQIRILMQTDEILTRGAYLGNFRCNATVSNTRRTLIVTQASFSPLYVTTGGKTRSPFSKSPQMAYY